MNERENNNFEIHPTVLKVLRALGLAAVLLAVYLTASVAITFCLGLFAGGNHVVKLPGIGDPIVSLEARQEKKRVLDPSELVEVARADFAVAGDVMLHMPIVRTAWTGDGYDFHNVFQYLVPYLSTTHLASATLETTLAGYDQGYSGEPWFNSPDEILPALRGAGFDLLVTSTEHVYDSDVSGLLRTLNTIRSQELSALGTVESADAARWSLQNMGGISVGMAAYTQSTIGDDGSVSVGTMTADAAAAVYLNAFDPERLSRFYTEVEGILSAMDAAGADISILYLHWGDDFTTTPSSTQRSIAQSLCDLGVDVIVGSHPHVVQPVDLLTSTVDGTHQTLVVYSAGTLLSNLRSDNTDVVSGHTEDGMIFRFSFSKYQDDSVRISSVGLLPTWTAVYGTGEERDFCVLPLDASLNNWAIAYDLTDDQLHDAKSSYNRTMAIVTSGLNKITYALGTGTSSLDPTLGVG